MKEYKMVNGKVVEDVEVNGLTDNNHQVIQGHYGNMPINIRRTFRSHRRRQTKKSRKNKSKKSKK